MKQIYAYLVLAVLISSCSQQKFSFRKKVRADEPVQIVKNNVQFSELSSLISEPAASELSIPSNYRSIHSNAKDQNLYQVGMSKASFKCNQAQHQNRLQKIKSAQVEEHTSPLSPKKIQEEGNGLAITGFVMSIVGLFIFPLLFSTMGIIFSVIGLKSEKRGLAIAGLVLGIIGLIAGIVILAILL